MKNFQKNGQLMRAMDKLGNDFSQPHRKYYFSVLKMTTKVDFVVGDSHVLRDALQEIILEQNFDLQFEEIVKDVG